MKNSDKVFTLHLSEHQMRKRIVVEYSLYVRCVYVKKGDEDA